MLRLLAVALAIVAARATDNDSRHDLYEKKEPHASMTNQLSELQLEPERLAEAAQLAVGKRGTTGQRPVQGLSQLHRDGHAVQAGC